MITSTAVTSNDALQSMVTTMQTSGGGMSLEMILIIALGLLVVGFVAWYFFFRSSGD